MDLFNRVGARRRAAVANRPDANVDITNFRRMIEEQKQVESATIAHLEAEKKERVRKREFAKVMEQFNAEYAGIATPAMPALYTGNAESYELRAQTRVRRYSKRPLSHETTDDMGQLVDYFGQHQSSVRPRFGDVPGSFIVGYVPRAEPTYIEDELAQVKHIMPILPRRNKKALLQSHFGI